MALAQPARAAIARIDRAQPVTRVRTMDDIAVQSVLRPRFRAGLVIFLLSSASSVAGL